MQISGESNARKMRKLDKELSEAECVEEFMTRLDHESAMLLFLYPGSAARVPPQVMNKLVAFEEHIAYNVASMISPHHALKQFLNQNRWDLVHIAIGQDGMLLRHILTWTRFRIIERKDTVLQGIKQNPAAIALAWDYIKHDNDFINKVAKENGNIYNFVPEAKQNELAFVQIVLGSAKNPVPITSVPEQFRWNLECLRISAQVNPGFLLTQPGIAALTAGMVDSDISQTGLRDLIAYAVGKYPGYYSSLTDDWKWDDSIITSALEADPMVLAYVMEDNALSEEDIHTYVELAVTKNGLAIQHAPWDMRSTVPPDDVLDAGGEDEEATPLEIAIEQNGLAFKYARGAAKESKELFERAAIQKDVKFKNAENDDDDHDNDIHYSIIYDTELLTACIAKNPLIIWLWPGQFETTDVDLVLAAVRSDGLLYSKISIAVAQGVRIQILAAAIKQNGRVMLKVPDWVAKEPYDMLLVHAIEQLKSDCYLIFDCLFRYNSVHPMQCYAKFYGNGLDQLRQRVPLNQLLNNVIKPCAGLYDPMKLAKCLNECYIVRPSNPARAMEFDEFYKRVLRKNPLVFRYLPYLFKQDMDNLAICRSALDADPVNIKYDREVFARDQLVHHLKITNPTAHYFLVPARTTEKRYRYA